MTTEDFNIVPVRSGDGYPDSWVVLKITLQTGEIIYKVLA